MPFKKVLPDISGSIQTENEEVISDDEDEGDNIPRQLSTLQALQNLDELLHFSMNQNNETLIGLISEAIEKVENIKLTSLRQSNISELFVKS